MPKLDLRKHLHHLNAPVVQKITHAWGGERITRKEECFDYLTRAIDSPDQVRKVLARCTPFEQAVLLILKRSGNASEAEALAALALLVGAPAPSSDRRSDEQLASTLLSLFEKGLLLTIGPVMLYQGDYTYFLSRNHWYSANDQRICSDDRILQEVADPQPNDPRITPLPVIAAAPPARTVLRRAQSVTLSHLAFLRALHEAGELKINKGGERAIASASLNKLGKKLEKQGWDNAKSFTLDGAAFPFPLDIYISAARNAGWFKVHPTASTLVPAITAEQFSAQPYAEQTRQLVQGLMASRDNLELGIKHDEHSFGFSYVRSARQILLTATALLPPNLLNSPSFVSLESFTQAIFNRIGLRFSIDDLPRPPSPYSFERLTPNQQKAELNKWAVYVQSEWHKHDVPWIRAALSGWMCAWGLVELGLDAAGSPISFRLTDVGRSVLGLTQEAADAEAEATQADATGVWVVQPNFDVLVYLERATARQLAFIEQYATRTNADQHTAHYRLTRESVYGALERGGTLEALTTRLSAGASQAVPPNVQRELREWAARREQLTLRQFARLIEFASPDARADAIQNGQPGQPIGERFLRIEGKASTRIGTHISFINYAQPLPPCLKISEDGEVTLDAALRDVLIESQLDTWAERDGAYWQLTEHSVQAALKQGLKFNQLVAFLDARLKSKLPALMDVALRAWAGEKDMSDALELGTAIVVRCKDEAMLRAIANSTRFKRCIRGTLAPNIALIKPERLDEFNEHLRWAGLKPHEFE